MAWGWKLGGEISRLGNERSNQCIKKKGKLEGWKRTAWTEHYGKWALLQ